ncbi:hypothetical protein QL285_081812 [Trifolium repens]|nr:hypothetical protein QL285_081812 [Trifolium repens]
MKKEAFVNDWIGRKHACDGPTRRDIDAQTCRCSSVRLDRREACLCGLDWSFLTYGIEAKGFIVGQAALKAASSKVTKHEKSFSDNQHAFIPFVFDTFDFLAPGVVDILKRAQWIMHNNVA